MLEPKPIYVETAIAAEMEEVWEVTQKPEQHQQWDLRFSSITYLPKEKEDDPQQFLYKTNIGFGLTIAGKGETVKTIAQDQTRSSSLKFWSDHPLSLIKKGSGYWKYRQEEGSLRFLTLYQYETRFGFLGKLVDFFIFRPLMGWATAWSFACMRLWLEKRIDPRVSLQRFMMHWLCVIVLSFIWIYQGLVPKIWFPDSGELDLLRSSGLFSGYEEGILLTIGILEVIFGMALLVLRRKKGIYLCNLILLLILTAGAVFSDPFLFVQPFNPVSLNLAMVTLSMIGILSLGDLVQAGSCKRQPGKEDQQAR